MRANFLRPVSKFLGAVLSTVTLGLIFTCPLPAARAQTPPPPADVQKILLDIDDLGLLKALVPLRLTNEQIDKLLVPMKEVVEGNPARRKVDHDALRAIAADLAKARADALAGEPVPPEIENKVTSVLSAASSRFTKNKQDAVVKVQTVAWDVFTPEQKDEIERQVGKWMGGKRLVPREYRNDPKKAPKDAVQGLAVQAFVESVLIGDRSAEILPLLKTGKADAAKPETKTDKDTKPADKP